MNCEEVKPALIDLVFGDLDADAGISLDLHLAACADCREEERRLLALRQLAAGTQAAPSRALRERIRAALPRRRGVRIRSLLGRPIPAYAAIAAAAAGAIVALLGSQVQLPESPRFAPPSAPASRTPPADERVDRYFTAAGCYATGVDPGPRFTLATDSSGRTRIIPRDSL